MSDCVQAREKIRTQLNAIAAAPYFDEEAQKLVDLWVGANVGFDAVEPILRFMEEHPTIDYGSPGGLVHFMERFWKNGYEEALLASIKRRPTEHTTWLLSRLINGEQRPPVRATYVAAMRDIASNSTTEAEARVQASNLLARLQS